MRREAFERWLVEERRVQANTARSYGGRALAVENKLGGDLDQRWSRSRLVDAISSVEADPDLGVKTRADYKTALNAYSDFCAR